MTTTRRQAMTETNVVLQRKANAAKKAIHAAIPMLDTLKHITSGSISNRFGRKIFAAVRSDGYTHDTFVSRFMTKFNRQQFNMANYDSYELTARGTGGIMFVSLDLYHPQERTVDFNAVRSPSIPSHIKL